jgi:hypothetical protein
MEISKRKFKLDISKEVKTYTSDDGYSCELSDEKLTSKVTEYIDSLIKNHNEFALKKCKERDIIHKVNSFEIDENIIKGKYDESNKETYNHFIHKYLRDYYVDSENSTHYTNGGNWEHSRYDPTTKLHERMLNGKLRKYEGSVRDLIFIHLLSGGSVRMYGNPQYFKRVVDLNSTENLKEFFRFILDSGMFKINEYHKLPKNIEKGDYLYSCYSSYRSIAELLIMECWRNGHNIEVIKWLHDEYGLDLYKVDDYKIESEYEEYTLFPRLFDELHDRRIHDTYNNGVLCRKYTYEKRKLNNEKLDNWMNSYFYSLVELYNFLLERYSDLPIESSYKGNIKKYDNIIDFMKDKIFYCTLDFYDEDNGEYQSIMELIDSLNILIEK